MTERELGHTTGTGNEKRRTFDKVCQYTWLALQGYTSLWHVLTTCQIQEQWEEELQERTKNLLTLPLTALSFNWPFFMEAINKLSKRRQNVGFILISFHVNRIPDEKTYLVRVIGEGSVGEIVVRIISIIVVQCSPDIARCQGTKKKLFVIMGARYIGVLFHTWFYYL